MTQGVVEVLNGPTVQERFERSELSGWSPQREALPVAPHATNRSDDSPVTAGHGLVVDSWVFGAVGVSAAWVSEGLSVLSPVRPRAYLVDLGEGWVIERTWGAGVAVSLPDGVHVLNPTEVGMGLNLAGEPLEHRMPTDVLAGLLVQGLALVGVAELRRVSAGWRAGGGRSSWPTITTQDQSWCGVGTCAGCGVPDAATTGRSLPRVT